MAGYQPFFYEEKLFRFEIYTFLWCSSRIGTEVIDIHTKQLYFFYFFCAQQRVYSLTRDSIVVHRIYKQKNGVCSLQRYASFRPYSSFAFSLPSPLPSPSSSPFSLLSLLYILPLFTSFSSISSSSSHCSVKVYYSYRR